VSRCSWIHEITGFRCALDKGHWPPDHDPSLEARARAKWPEAPQFGEVPPEPEPEPVDPRQMALFVEKP